MNYDILCVEPQWTYSTEKIISKLYFFFQYMFFQMLSPVGGHKCWAMIVCAMTTPSVILSWTYIMIVSKYIYICILLCPSESKLLLLPEWYLISLNVLLLYSGAFCEWACFTDSLNAQNTNIILLYSSGYSKPFCADYEWKRKHTHLLRLVMAQYKRDTVECRYSTVKYNYDISYTTAMTQALHKLKFVLIKDTP